MLSAPNNNLRGASVFNDSTLSNRAKITYGVMLKYADVNGRFTLNHATLMREMNLAKKTVAVATKELVEHGVLKRQRVGNAVQYQFLR
jgi:predicted transcriptional regulator